MQLRAFEARSPTKWQRGVPTVFFGQSGQPNGFTCEAGRAGGQAGGAGGMTALNEAADYCARMYQIRKTCFSMLVDRGYEVDERDRSETFDAFKAACTDQGHVNDPGQLTMRATRPGQSKKRVIILFSGKKDKFATEDVKYLFNQVDDEWQVSRALCTRWP